MKARDAPAPKWGAGHAGAMGRIGTNELRNMFYTDSNVARSPIDYGVFGNSTPGEVAAARESDVPSMDEERGSIIESRVRQAESYRNERGRDDRGLERE